jgi:hypothetical protein
MTLVSSAQKFVDSCATKRQNKPKKLSAKNATLSNYMKTCRLRLTGKILKYLS